MERRGFLGALFGTAAATAGVAAVSQPVQAKPVTGKSSELSKALRKINSKDTIHRPIASLQGTYISPLPPENPVIGSLWVDTSDVYSARANIYDGSDWAPLSAGY
jgi:hypothetical protein